MAKKPAKGGLKKRFNAAVLVIDVQRRFCQRGYLGNNATEAAARNIAEAVPHFREAGAQVYAIRYGMDEDLWLGSAFNAASGYYRFKPVKGDVQLVKYTDSVFVGTDISRRLKRAGIKKLVVCGVNLNACVYASVMGALRAGFNVTVMTDLVANGSACHDTWAADYLQNMKMKGAQLRKSSATLKTVRRLR